MHDVHYIFTFLVIITDNCISYLDRNAFQIVTRLQLLLNFVYIDRRYNSIKPLKPALAYTP